MTRSPTTIGDDVPAPASVARHARCSVALHVVGSGASVEIAALPGPRHCGQSCAAALAAAVEDRRHHQAGPHAAHAPGIS